MFANYNIAVNNQTQDLSIFPPPTDHIDFSLGAHDWSPSDEDWFQKRISAVSGLRLLNKSSWNKDLRLNKSCRFLSKNLKNLAEVSWDSQKFDEQAPLL